MTTVSVIIPVRDEALGIEQLLEDLLGQTRAALEVIVADTGSTDGTVEKIERVARRDGRVRLVAATGHLPGGGRNAGLRVARGDWVAFVDGGMRVAPDWIARLMAPVDAGEAVDVVLGGLEPVAETRWARAAALAFVPARRPTPTGGQWRGYCLPSSAVRASLARELGFSEELRSGEDLLFFHALQSRARIAWAPGAVVHWRHAATPRHVWRRFRTYAEHSFRADLMKDWFVPMRRRYLALALATGPALPLSALSLLLARAVAMQQRKPEFVDPTIIGRVRQIGEVAVCLAAIDVATWQAWVAWRAAGRPRARLGGMNGFAAGGDQRKRISAGG